MASKQQGQVALECLKANRDRATGMTDFENVGAAVEMTRAHNRKNNNRKKLIMVGKRAGTNMKVNCKGKSHRTPRTTGIKT